MRDARIRVLLHPKLEQHERKAALEAADRFSRFGLRVEGLDEKRGDVWKDLCRERVYELVLKEGGSALYGDEPLGRPHYFARVPHDGAILAGLTPFKLYHAGTGSWREIDGFNMYYVGAVVSTSPFKMAGGGPYRTQGSASIEEAAGALTLRLMHELGHSLLGREPVMKLFAKDDTRRYDDGGHCMSSGCIMQDVTDYVSFLRSAAESRIDFCDGCADLLKGRVTEINWYGCA